MLTIADAWTFRYFSLGFLLDNMHLKEVSLGGPISWWTGATVIGLGAAGL
jgi:hypothetical protein